MRRGWRRTLDALVAVVTTAGAGLAVPSPASAADSGAAFFESVPAASSSAPHFAYVGDPYTVLVGTSAADGWETCRIDYGDGVEEAGNRQGPSCVQGKTWESAGTRTVTATLTAAAGETSTATVEVEVRERPTLAEVDSVEGAPVALTAPGTMRGGSLTWSLADADSVCSFDDPSASEPTLTCGADGSHEARVTAADGESARVLVRVANGAPYAGPVRVSAYRGPQRAGQRVQRTVTGQALTVLATAIDPGDADPVTCRTDFGDGTVLADSGPGVTGSVQCGGPHAYTRPGRYQVAITVTDDDGAETTTTRTVRVDHRATRGWVRGPIGKARVASSMKLTKSSGPKGSFRLRLPNGRVVVGGRPRLVETWKQPTGQVRRELSWEGRGTLRGKRVSYRVDLGANKAGRVVRQRVSVFSAKRLIFHTVTTPAKGAARVKVG